jgi:O-acetyl-ADP-ribose deacetylase (regulator of RNase III)
LDAPESSIAHGCNSHGVMGSGVAAAIRAAYPEAYEVYRAAYQRTGLALGQVIPVDCGRHTVLNCITQKDFGGQPGVVYVSYEAVAACVEAINDLTDQPVAFPLIGAGLAGGSWVRIAGILSTKSTFRPVVYTLDGRIPAT